MTTASACTHHRFRFCSKDPIGFRGSKWSLYEYVMSRPTIMKDPTGLVCFVGPCLLPSSYNFAPRSETECCSDAKASGIDNDDLGGVVCCDGKTVTCTWNIPITTSVSAKNIISDCIRKHEDSHHADIVPCKTGICARGISRGKFALLQVHGRNTSECDAYRIEINCLTSSIAKCNGDAICEGWVEHYIQESIEGLLKYCSGSPWLPKL